MSNFDLGKLERHERLWLWRRRQPTGLTGPRGRNGHRMSAHEAALALGLSPEVYMCAELSSSSEYGEMVWDRLRAQDPEGATRDPDAGDLCALARRRAAAAVRELCGELGGVTKPYFYKLEERGDERLVALWQRRGYAFNPVDMATVQEI